MEIQVLALSLCRHHASLRTVDPVRLALCAFDTFILVRYHVLHIPFVQTRILRASRRSEQILQYAMQAAHDSATNMGLRLYVSFAKEFVAWLAKFGTSDAGTPDCAPATALALENGHE